ncbi:Undecaprenyl-diphosphatase [hydrothermal vent metagenome]|uniref:Undecaprenyl-diphosphatase n=1 Tax=hydrothermal vent metagenome TaxID=652676 RepID=A0A3B0SEX7_9ZZZZ
MTLLHLFIIATVQGLTEFLPVSSSGHLILIPYVTNWPDQGQVIDVAVHIGTLLAVVIYFWRDVAQGFAGIPRMLTGRIDTPGSRLAFLLMIATIPVIIVGLLLVITDMTDMLRSIKVIGWTMLGFGVLLYWVDQKGATSKTEHDWTLRHAIIMGLWQAVSLIPGTSRSGITITAARALGYARHDAAKLSMLMSIPTIIASGTLLGIKALADADMAALRAGAIGVIFAFIAALFALSLMMRLLRSVSFTPYVIYRIILGVILLSIAYS